MGKFSEKIFNLTWKDIGSHSKHIYTYTTSFQKVSSYVLWKRDIYWRRYKIQKTLYTGQWCLGPLQSRHLTQFSQLPSAALVCFPESHQQSEISSFSKVILLLRKARGCRAPNLGCRGAESPGWFDVLPKNSAQDMMHGWACCCDEAANHQLPIASAFWITWIVSMEECSSAEFDTESLLYLLHHFDCCGHTVHMLTQWRLPPPLTSTVRLSLFTPAHSCPLSLAARLHLCHVNRSHYINDGWTFSGQTS